mmetsp:Transcript_14060/g.34911  ORF Transcript_14060/g.34911 Transcript_14060/m.34911 type:complete len:245 (-) Transcript_14060:379-1113(-)
MSGARPLRAGSCTASTVMSSTLPPSLASGEPRVAPKLTCHGVISVVPSDASRARSATAAAMLEQTSPPSARTSSRIARICSSKRLSRTPSVVSKMMSPGSSSCWYRSPSDGRSRTFILAAHEDSWKGWLCACCCGRDFATSCSDRTSSSAGRKMWKPLSPTFKKLATLPSGLMQSKHTVVDPRSSISARPASSAISRSSKTVSAWYPDDRMRSRAFAVLAASSRENAPASTPFLAQPLTPSKTA